MFRHYSSVDDQKHADAMALANPIYSWHASYFTVHRHRMLGFVNDTSGVFVVVPYVTTKDYSHLYELFAKHLISLFHEFGLSTVLAKQYLRQAGDWQINHTINRSLVGNLTLKLTDAKAIMNVSPAGSITSLSRGLSYPDASGESFKELPDWVKPTAKAKSSKPSIDTLRLQNDVQQLRYIEAHRDQLAVSPKFDQQVDKIQHLNNDLIDAFVEDNKSQLGAKTLRRHRQRLTDFLNEDISFHLSTIFGDEVLDLEEPLYHGWSFNEMRQTRTALKKFYQFLLDQELISMEEWQQVKTTLNEQLQYGDPSMRWGMDDFDGFF